MFEDRDSVIKYFFLDRKTCLKFSLDNTVNDWSTQYPQKNKGDPRSAEGLWCELSLPLSTYRGHAYSLQFAAGSKIWSAASG